MTREEAIKSMEYSKAQAEIALSKGVSQYWKQEINWTIEAIDMAIEALKQVADKLNNPDDSLLTADSEACKEQKSKLDLISRAEAIEAVRLESAKRGLLGRGDILDILSALPPADRPRGEWTPCEEKLPSEKKAVLICDSHGNRFVGKLVLTDHGYKWSVPLFKVSKVWVDIEDGDAWMPLPEPYKESDTK